MATVATPVSATGYTAGADGPGPTATSPTTLSRARSGFKSFSRRFERRPKSINIAALPQTAAVPASKDGTNGSTTLINHNAASSPPRTPENARISTSSTLSSPPPVLRPPQLHRLHSQIFASSKDFKLPELPWLCGTWYVTHSSLPVWRDKRDVRITYTRIPGDRLDDVVTFRQADNAGGAVVGEQQVRGVDKVLPDGSYMWRGRGFGMVKVAKWEVLGWGGGGSSKGAGVDPNAEQWLITYSSRTMFSPPGIVVCSRNREGLSPRRLKKLMQALHNLDEVLRNENRGGKEEEGKGDFSRLVESLVEVPR